MSKRREAFITYIKKFEKLSSDEIMIILGNYISEQIIELDGKDEQIETLKDHIRTLKND